MASLHNLHCMLMKAITFEPTMRRNGRELRLNANEEKRHGCFVPILDRIDSCMNTMLAMYCKLYVVQFVFHPEFAADNNVLISDLMRVVKKQLERKYRSKLAYGWVREAGKNGKHHHHIVLLLNGNRVQAQQPIRDCVFKIFADREQPRPGFNERAHKVLRRDLTSYVNAFYHLSYLAKVSTKGRKPKTTNEYSFSRLKAPEGAPARRKTTSKASIRVEVISASCSTNQALNVPIESHVDLNSEGI